MLIANLLPATYAPVFWVLLGIVGTLGLVALVSPRAFACLAEQSSRWVDASKCLEYFDRQVNVDKAVLPFCRLLGAAVVCAVCVLGVMVTRY